MATVVLEKGHFFIYQKQVDLTIIFIYQYFKQWHINIVHTMLKQCVLLTLYQTFPTFNFPRKVFQNILEKKEKMLVTSIFLLFPEMFSTCPNTNFIFLVTFIMSSASSLNVDWFRIFSFRKRWKSESEIVIKENISYQDLLLLQHNFFQKIFSHRI